MGSSAMGASMLKKKLEAAELGIRATNAAINSLPADADLIITHKDLTERARRAAPTKAHISISNFMDGAAYDRIVAELKAKASGSAAPTQGDRRL